MVSFTVIITHQQSIVVYLTLRVIGTNKVVVVKSKLKTICSSIVIGHCYYMYMGITVNL